MAERLAVGDPLNHSYLFRGHEDADWALQPSLHRAATNDGKTALPDAAELLRIESILTEQFLAVAPGHLPAGNLTVTRRAVEWWPLMRHFGVPTRALDWTASIYVATYFSVSRCPDKDGAVYVVHVSTLGRQ